MSITAAMKAAGWRELPSNAVRKAWEAKNGRWETLQWNGHDYSPIGSHNPDPSYEAIEIMECVRVGAWRPVSLPTWDYAPEGWADPVPERQKGCNVHEDCTKRPASGRGSQCCHDSECPDCFGDG
jgi:hypothetical protein